MSKLVCRMAKVKKKSVRGFQIHNLRELKSKTNPDIDPTRSHLNKDFINDQPINFKKKWEKRIEEGYTINREIRHDATLYNEFIIGSDKEFFDKLDQAEKDRFFKTATDFFTERYGKENVLYSIAHYDELRGAGAHAHVAVVPLKDGKLTSKAVFDRKELRYLQEELPKALQRAGFDIERGRKGSKAQHIETATFKMMKAEEAEKLAIDETKYAQQHLDLLNEEIEAKTAALDKIEEIESVEYQEMRTWYGKKSDQVVVDYADFDQIKQLAENHEKLKTELVHANQEYRTLQEKYVDLEKEKDRYADQNHKLGLELHQHKTDVERIVKESTKIEREELFEKANDLVEKNKKIAIKEIDKIRQEVNLLKSTIVEKDEEIEYLKVGFEVKKNQVHEKDQQIRKLSDELELLKQSFEKYKNHVKDQIEKAVKETTKIVRKAMMKANHEWIKTNLDSKATVDHSFAEKEIEQRSEEIRQELVQKEIEKEQNKGLDRDGGMER